MLYFVIHAWYEIVNTEEKKKFSCNDRWTHVSFSLKNLLNATKPIWQIWYTGTFGKKNFKIIIIALKLGIK